MKLRKRWVAVAALAVLAAATIAAALAWQTKSAVAKLCRIRQGMTEIQVASIMRRPPDVRRPPWPEMSDGGAWTYCNVWDMGQDSVLTVCFTEDHTVYASCLEEPDEETVIDRVRRWLRL